MMMMSEDIAGWWASSTALDLTGLVTRLDA